MAPRRRRNTTRRLIAVGSTAVVASLAAACAASSDRVGSTATNAAASSAVVSPSTAAVQPGESVSLSTTSTLPPSTLPTSTEGLAATLERYREDDTTHVIQIQLVNRSAKVVRVTDLALHWSGMSAQAPSPQAHVLAPTQLADLPVPQGESLCSDPPRLDQPLPADLPYATAMASFADGPAADTSATDEPPAQVRVPITDTRGVLARLFLADCYQKAIAYSADIGFVDWNDATVDGRPAMTVNLRIHRLHGDEPIAVSDVRGSVLLATSRAKPGDGPLVRAAPGEQDVSAGLIFTETGDCRPHALAESKHTFFLPTEITVGSAAPVTVYLFPDETAKARLLAMINRSCGVA